MAAAEADMPETWHLLQSGPGDFAWNMAVDEMLLEFAGANARPLLRFYSWNQAAASFGYSQRYAELARATALRPLVRRPTGGGLVPHDADWTYSLIFPPGHAWYGLKAVASYRRVHEWLQAAFARLDIPTELSPCCRKEIPGQCFAGAEQSDLLWHGKKIAGAAQRRTRHGLLIQGSVQPPPIPVAKADWQKAVCDAAHFDWQVRWEAFELDKRLLDRAKELAADKYIKDEYNRRR
jgi:lipoyl(octanoyl) transferase